MAENLGANFTIDITDLKAGLAQANRLIRESESEFLAAAAGMEDWEDSAEGLQKRIKTLSNQVEIQQGKVNALVKEKERIIRTMTDEGESHEDIEKAVDGVNKSIQREGKRLDTLKKKLKQSEKNLDKFEDATEDADDALGDMGDEMDDTRDATDKLNDEIKDQKTQLKQLIREYSNVAIEQGDTSDEAKDLKKKIKDLNSELQTSEKRLKDATDGLEDLGDEAKDVGGGFTIAKGAAAGLVANGLTAIASGAIDAFSSMMDLAESTRETRTNMARLETAFETAGLSAEDASATFTTLYGVLGDEDKATEAASFLAKYADNEEELAEQTRILTGVFAEYGDSIPTEGLAEGIAASIEMGEVQGVLADALEWQGINLEDFNEKLAACTSEKEREALITETLNELYGESADAFVDNNAAVIEAQEAAADYNDSMAELGGKFEPLNTAFTNLKTTLVDAVTPAVGALAQGMADLINNMIAGEENTDLLTESQRAIVTSAADAAEEYQNLSDAADTMANSQLANIGYAEKILEKLDGIVDETGNVKAGQEAHAEYLLGEYNKALGTEYDQLSDIFDKNGEIKDSIYEVIEAKKVQVLMKAYEEQFQQAVLNVGEAEKARAIQAQELAAQEKVAAEARDEYNAKNTEYYNALYDASNTYTEADIQNLARQRTTLWGNWTKEEGVLNDKRVAYNNTESTLSDYYSTISAYENASASLIEGKTDEAISHLGRLGNGFQTVASTAQLSADEQYKILEQQVIDTEVNAQLMRDAYERGVGNVTQDMVDTAEAQAEAAKVEFKNIGGDITEGIGEGAEGKKWTLSSTMSRIIASAVSAAKAAAEMNSPSRLFKREVGRNIGLGIAGGVDESTDDVVDSIDTQIDSALKAYDVGKINDAISGSVNVKASGAGGSGGLANGSNGGVTVNQNNYYSQAHSRYELYKNKQATEAAVRLAMGGA